MDLTNATFLQLAIQLNVTVTIDKAIVIQYSNDGGITWNTTRTLYYNSLKRNYNNPPIQIIQSIHRAMQTRTTRVRIWQPGIQVKNDAIWRIDDFYIGGETVTSGSVNTRSDFTASLSPDMWPSHAGGVTGSAYCDRDSVILFSNSSNGLHHLTTTFFNFSMGENLMQFEVSNAIVYLKHLLLYFRSTLAVAITQEQQVLLV